MFVGYVLVTYFWPRAAQMAEQKCAEGSADDLFCASTVDTAQFYYAKLLLGLEALKMSILA